MGHGPVTYPRRRRIPFSPESASLTSVDRLRLALRRTEWLPVSPEDCIATKATRARGRPTEGPIKVRCQAMGN